MERLILFLNKLLYKLKLFRKNLFYVGGNDALPPPLSKDEEEDLLNAENQEEEANIELSYELYYYISKEINR